MTFRVFDGFCKAGGAGEGYRRAGADVYGMDIQPQPRNPHRFEKGDVMELLRTASGVGWLRSSFDLLHFSPPCQGYSAMRHAPGARGSGDYPLLIAEIRQLARRVGLPYVIENVEEARWDMVDPVLLCGSMFGLGWDGPRFRGYLQRHRLFECSFPVTRPPCSHPRPQPVIGFYGGHARVRAASAGGRGTREDWRGGVPHLQVGSSLLGIGWMSADELSEAIPPAYTEYLANQFLAWRASAGGGLPPVQVG